MRGRFAHAGAGLGASLSGSGSISRHGSLRELLPLLHANFEEAFRYLEQHTEVRDVLLSGGDALLFSDDKLEKILSRLRAISHVEFLRIGTRVPIFLPQRITPELCAMLQKYHPLWMSVHVNHPRELTIEVKEALERLANHGIPLGNQ